jgi:hypothetical protein
MAKNSELSPKEKQEIWRQKQIYIFYGSGRPIFNINERNLHLKSSYDNTYYFQKYINSFLQTRKLIKEYDTYDI